MGGEWAAVVGTLLGVILGGTIDHLAKRSAFKSQKKWQRDQFLKDKLEELAVAVDELNAGWEEFCLQAINKIATGAPLKPLKTKLPFGKLQMLVSFYAPNLEEHLKAVRAVRDQMSVETASTITGGADDKESKGKALLELQKRWGEMDLACKQLGEAAAAEARSRFAMEQEAKK